MTNEAIRAPSQDEYRRAWRRTALFFLLATAPLFYMFYESLAAMVVVWMTSDTYNYGFVVPPVVLFLCYQRRHQLAIVMPQPCFWALIWLTGALLIDLIGTAGSIMLLKQVAFVAFLQGTFALLAGWTAVKVLLFPLFFLFFSVPMGAEAVPFLQTITAEIAVFLLRISGVPTYHSGVLIEIPSARFVVADVCSGIRFFIATIVLGTLAANIFYVSWSRRTLFMLLCIVLPIMANGLRAYTIILLAHLVDLNLAASADHILFGFALFSIVLVILIILGARTRDRPSIGKIFAPIVSPTHSHVSSSILAFLLAVTLLGGGQLWSQHVSMPPSKIGQIELADLRPGEPWHPISGTLAGWAPAFSGADIQHLTAYRSEQGEVAFFVAHYFYQRDAHEIIAVGNSFVGKGKEREVTRFEDVEIFLDGQRLRVKERRVELIDGPHLIWSWYDIGGRWTVSPAIGKLFEVWHRLIGGRRAATAFALLTRAGGDLPEDRARLQAFLEALLRADTGIPALVQSKT